MSNSFVHTDLGVGVNHILSQHIVPFTTHADIDYNQYITMLILDSVD